MPKHQVQTKMQHWFSTAPGQVTPKTSNTETWTPPLHPCHLTLKNRVIEAKFRVIADSQPPEIHILPPDRQDCRIVFSLASCKLQYGVQNESPLLDEYIWRQRPKYACLGEFLRVFLYHLIVLERPTFASSSPSFRANDDFKWLYKLNWIVTELTIWSEYNEDMFGVLSAMEQLHEWQERGVEKLRREDVERKARARRSLRRKKKRQKQCRLESLEQDAVQKDQRKTERKLKLLKIEAELDKLYVEWRGPVFCHPDSFDMTMLPTL
ncbi:hypothetical protein BJX61DRAFT_544090 [Aspergillus egyptiacus]|nr:hypothetical protein BJX61DRAFT_544090 [Aspergillus egyptiacus]